LEAEYIDQASFTVDEAGELSDKIDVNFGVANLDESAEGIDAEGEATAKITKVGNI